MARKQVKRFEVSHVHVGSVSEAWQVAGSYFPGDYEKDDFFGGLEWDQEAAREFSTVAEGEKLVARCLSSLALGGVNAHKAVDRFAQRSVAPVADHKIEGGAAGEGVHLRVAPAAGHDNVHQKARFAENGHGVKKRLAGFCASRSGVDDEKKLFLHGRPSFGKKA